MNVLGISGRDRDAAAALAVDGKIVSAVAEESFARVPGIGYAQSGGFPRAAVKACLDRAGLEPADVHEVVIVDDGRVKPPNGCVGPFRGIPVKEVAADRADAWHAAITSGHARAVLVCGSDPATMARFTRRENEVGPRTEIPGAADLVRVARRVAEMLGTDNHDPFAAIDRLAHGGAPAFATDFLPNLEARANKPIHVDADVLTATIARVAGAHGPNLADVDSLNARLQETRRDIAASFVSRVASIVSEVAAGVETAPMAAGGALFGNAAFNTELSRLAPDHFAIPAVPEAIGRAVGAVASTGGVEAGEHVALGPIFTEEDIKRTLDNCRLDYVYEPDWSRLLGRVSRMLAQGKLVGWFQGAMAFGPRSVGTRSILADPSNRYARQNVNEYLRYSPADEPLPLAFAASMRVRCLGGEGAESGVRDVTVNTEWHQALAGALDTRQAARVHGNASILEPQLSALLEHHAAATSTPALIEVNLAGPGEPLACTPRDAVRTVYSSAIDALVIGRFLLMKDYWLLRSGE